VKLGFNRVFGIVKIGGLRAVRRQALWHLPTSLFTDKSVVKNSGAVG
jgi:hypothetical protein